MTDRPKFSRAMMLRVGAVGLFLALGTFAVLHSLNNSPADEMTGNKTEPGESDSGAVAVAEEDNKSKIDKTSFDAPVSDEEKKKTTSPPWASTPDTAGKSGSVANLLPQPTAPGSLSPNPADPGTGTPPHAPRTGPVSTADSRFNGLFPPSSASPEKSGSTAGGSFGNSGSGAIAQQPPTAPPLRPGDNSGSSFSPASLGANNKTPFSNADLSQPEKSAEGASGSQFPPSKPGDSPQFGSTGENPADAPGAGSNGFRVQVNGGRSDLSPVADKDNPASNPAGTSQGDFRGNSDSGSPTVPRPDPWSSNNNPSAMEKEKEPGSGSAIAGIQPVVNPNTPPTNPGIISSGLRPAGNSGFPSQDRPGGSAGTSLNGGTIAASDPASGRPIQSNLPTSTNATFGRIQPASTPVAASAGASTQPVPGDTRLEGLQIPTLAVQKVAPREVQVNREATFELVVKNTGRTPANQVRVHDQIPNGARFVSANPPPAENAGGQLVWDLGTVNPGQQVSIQMTVLPEQPGEMGSVAHVTFGAQATARTTCTQPQLALRHEAPESVLVGQDFQMNIILENRGNGPAEEVVLLEDVPEGLDFGTGQKELEYPIGTLRPGEVRQVPLRLRASRVGHVKNVLVATGAGKLQAETTVNLRIVSPQLTLSIDGATRKFLKRPATHSITVSNPGSAPALNVQVVARLPRGLQFSSANNQGQYDPNSHAVVWRLARLDSQKSGVTELVTVPIAAGKHEIQVQATADPGQQQVASHSLEVEQLSSLYFDIAETSGPVETGSPAAYRVRIVNQGQVPAANVTAQVTFAQGVRPDSANGPVRAQVNGQSVIMEPVATLSPGQELTFVIQATAVGPGEHRSTLSVRSDDREVAGTKEISTHVYSDR